MTPVLARYPAGIGRLLVSALTGQSVNRDEATKLSPSPIAFAAERHRVSGYVHAALRDAGLEVAALRDAAHRDVGQHLRVRSELASAAQLLDAARVPWVVVKGPVLSEYVHSLPARRSYTDLDLVVAPRDLERSVELLVADGARLLERNHKLVRQRLPGELHLMSARGVLIDLHWTLINGHRAREAFRVETSDLLERRHSVTVGSMTVPTTGPEDTLLHLALHAALSGGDRLVWLKDIEQVLANLAVDPDRVSSRARSWGVDQALALMLARTRRVLGTDRGREIERRLSVPPPWRWAGTAADRLSPVQSCKSAKLARLVARSSRPAADAGAQEMARRMMEAARRRAPRQKVAASESVMHENPDPAQLAAYYRAVRATAEPSR